MNYKKNRIIFGIISVVALVIGTYIINQLFFHKDAVYEDMHYEPRVCVTATGDCYHSPSCKYDGNGFISMGLYEAKAAGYRACSHCGGRASGRIECGGLIEQESNDYGVSLFFSLIITLSCCCFYYFKNIDKFEKPVNMEIISGYGPPIDSTVRDDKMVFSTFDDIKNFVMTQSNSRIKLLNIVYKCDHLDLFDDLTPVIIKLDNMNCDLPQINPYFSNKFRGWCINDPDAIFNLENDNCGSIELEPKFTDDFDIESYSGLYKDGAQIMTWKQLTEKHPNSFSSFDTIESFDSLSGDLLIDESITRIKDYAFCECKELESVYLPRSITDIGKGIFEYCSQLKQITVSVYNKKYDSRNDCDAIIETDTNIIISTCKNTRIPESVYKIGAHSFSGRLDLIEFKTPDQIEEIGEGAFADCDNLEKVYISECVKNIDEDVFRTCISLKEILVSDNNKVYDSRDNCNAIIKSWTNTLVVGCSGTVIPDTITSIASKAFNECLELTSIIVPKSVIYVRDGAFSDCSNLEYIFYKGSNPRTVDWGDVDAAIKIYSEFKPLKNKKDNIFWSVEDYWHFDKDGKTPFIWTEN